MMTPALLQKMMRLALLQQMVTALLQKMMRLALLQQMVTLQSLGCLVLLAVYRLWSKKTWKMRVPLLNTKNSNIFIPSRSECVKRMRSCTDEPQATKLISNVNHCWNKL